MACGSNRQSFIPEPWYNFAGAQDVKKALLDSGISECTIYNIKKELGVESFKIDNIWHMRLPE